MPRTVQYARDADPMPPADGWPEVMTTADVARRLRISDQQVRNLAHRGDLAVLPRDIVGNRVLIPRWSVDELIARAAPMRPGLTIVESTAASSSGKSATPRTSAGTAGASTASPETATTPPTSASQAGRRGH